MKFKITPEVLMLLGWLFFILWMAMLCSNPVFGGVSRVLPLHTIMEGDSIFGNFILDAADSVYKTWNGSNWVFGQDLTCNYVTETITIYNPQNSPTDTTRFGFNKAIDHDITITRLFAECDSSGYSFVIGSMGLQGGSITVIDTLTLSTAGVNCYKKDITSGFDNANISAGRKLWLKSLGSEDPTYLYLLYTYTINDPLAPCLVWGAEITIQNDTNIEDMELRSEQPDNNYNNRTYYYTSDAKRFLIGLKDLDDIIGSNSLVTVCSLGVYCKYFSTGVTVSVYEVYRNAVEAQATWNIYKTDSTWETAGCEGTTYDRSADAMDSFSKDQSNMFYYIDIDTAWVNDIVRNDVERWLLYKKTAGAGNDTYFYSSEYTSNPDWCPIFYITYELTSAPDTPARTKPDSAATHIVPDSCEFTYSAIGADSFEVWCDDDDDFSSVVFDSILAATTLKYNLAVNTTYYWKVAAKNTIGWSDTTTVWPFTTGESVPSFSAYYVSTEGDDGNPGDFWKPWRTVNYALTNSAASHGDTIYIMGGDYKSDANIAPTKAPSNDDSLMIMVLGYPGQDVYLSRTTLPDSADRYHFENLHWDTIHSGVKLLGTDYITFKNCTFRYNDYCGLNLANQIDPPDSTVDYLTIEDCEFNDNGQAQSDPEHHIIIFCYSTNYLYIHRSDILMGYGKGIAYASSGVQQSTGCRVDSCNIINCFESGIDIRGWKNSYFRWNYLRYNGLRDTEEGEWGDKNLRVGNDAGVTSDSVWIYQNLSLDAGHRAFGVGADGKLFVWNNIFRNTILYSAVPDEPPGYERAPIIAWDGDYTYNVEFYNNIFISELTDSLKHYVINFANYQDFNSCDWNHNLYYATTDTSWKHWRFNTGSPPAARMSFTEIQAEGYESNGMWADPLFTAPADSDFTLQQGSPCIDAGVDVGLPYNGDAPDIGAFESDYGSGEPSGSQVIIMK